MSAFSTCRRGVRGPIPIIILEAQCDAAPIRASQYFIACPWCRRLDRRCHLANSEALWYHNQQRHLIVHSPMTMGLGGVDGYLGYLLCDDEEGYNNGACALETLIDATLVERVASISSQAIKHPSSHNALGRTSQNFPDL